MSGGFLNGRNGIGSCRRLIVAKVSREILTFASEFCDSFFSDFSERAYLSRNLGVMQHAFVSPTSAPGFVANLLSTLAVA